MGSCLLTLPLHPSVFVWDVVPSYPFSWLCLYCRKSCCWGTKSSNGRLFAIKPPELGQELEGSVRVNGHIRGYVSGTIDAKVQGVIHGEVHAIVDTEGKKEKPKEEPTEEQTEETEREEGQTHENQ